jgi:hypothetical protein
MQACSYDLHRWLNANVGTPLLLSKQHIVRPSPETTSIPTLERIRMWISSPCGIDFCCSETSCTKDSRTPSSSWLDVIAHRVLIRFQFCKDTLLVLDTINMDCSQSRSHITTDNLSASPSWCQAPIWDLRPIFPSPWDFLLYSYCLLFYSALSDEKTGL